jgi:hypothetical protein
MIIPIMVLCRDIQNCRYGTTLHPYNTCPQPQTLETKGTLADDKVMTVTI